MRHFLLLFTILLMFRAQAQERRLYVKPHLNFQFPLTKTIRQDYLPYAKINNNHCRATIMPGVRFEYLKSNGNGYFINIGTVPVGYSITYTDYSHIDQFYRLNAPRQLMVSSFAWSSNMEAWVADIGFINRLGFLHITRKKAIDVKLGYGITLGTFRPYNILEFHTSGAFNSMNKEFAAYSATYPFYDINKGKFAFMVPVKLDLNIKNKSKNVELLNFEFAYWQSFTRAQQNKITYNNITDNVSYENVTESRGSAWQMSIQIPIRIKQIGKLKF